MKYLILLLMMSLNLNAQILKPSEDVEKYITSSTEQLCKRMFSGPLFQQPIVYIQYAPLHPFVIGLTREISPSIFMVDLNPIYDFNRLEWTLLHELVHVEQIWNNRLTKVETGFEFNGIYYPFSFPYSLRPWENEAEEIVRQLCND